MKVSPQNVYITIGCTLLKALVPRSWVLRRYFDCVEHAYYFQNTYKKDNWKATMTFYRHLKRREWIRDKPVVSAHDKLTCSKLTNNKSIEEEISNKEQLILHLEYHPNDIPKRKLRETWNECCRDLLSKPTNKG